MGAIVSIRSSHYRTRSRFVAQVLPVRLYVLDDTTNHQSNRTAKQGIQAPHQNNGGDRRRDLNLPMSHIRGTNHGVPLELSSRLSMGQRLHTKCRLTLHHLSHSLTLPLSRSPALPLSHSPTLPLPHSPA